MYFIEFYHAFTCNGFTKYFSSAKKVIPFWGGRSDHHSFAPTILVRVATALMTATFYCSTTTATKRATLIAITVTCVSCGKSASRMPSS